MDWRWGSSSRVPAFQALFLNSNLSPLAPKKRMLQSSVGNELYTSTTLKLKWNKHHLDQIPCLYVHVKLFSSHHSHFILTNPKTKINRPTNLSLSLMCKGFLSNCSIWVNTEFCLNKQTVRLYFVTFFLKGRSYSRGNPCDSCAENSKRWNQ
jgi:hypothetical protein